MKNKTLKIWLDISPFIPLLGILLVLYQVIKYNPENKDIYGFGIFNTFIFIISGLIQAFSVIFVITKLIR